MNTKEALKIGMDLAEFVCQAYLADLTDADLMKRAAPGINHINWQVGHIIHSGYRHIEDSLPGSMPPLPADFAAKYAKDAATNDDPKSFYPKEKLLAFHKTQREAQLAALDKLSDADLDKPSPEAYHSYAPTVGSLFSLQGSHWLMHCGQWAVVRRQLGHPPLF